MASAPSWRVHDLLRIDALTDMQDAPSWVACALGRAPWVVVRRARRDTGLVPVGVRGSARSERHAASIGEAAILQVLSPEMLVAAPIDPARCSVPALALLAWLKPVLEDFALTWGPTGSVGFELASGQPTVKDSSDLDLVIRCPERLPAGHAKRLRDALVDCARRAGRLADAQIEVPAGAVSLQELAAGGRVLLRTAQGPRLTSDPWS